MVEEGEPEPEFETILNVVDPNRDGFVTLQEYMAFMISKETENVQSSEEIENAFRAITAQERDYVTQEELDMDVPAELPEPDMDVPAELPEPDMDAAAEQPEMIVNPTKVSLLVECLALLVL